MKALLYRIFFLYGLNVLYIYFYAPSHQLDIFYCIHPVYSVMPININKFYFYEFIVHKAKKEWVERKINRHALLGKVFKLQLEMSNVSEQSIKQIFLLSKSCASMRIYCWIMLKNMLSNLVQWFPLFRLIKVWNYSLF